MSVSVNVPLPVTLAERELSSGNQATSITTSPSGRRLEKVNATATFARVLIWKQRGIWSARVKGVNQPETGVAYQQTESQCNETRRGGGLLAILNGFQIECESGTMQHFSIVCDAQRRQFTQLMMCRPLRLMPDGNSVKNAPGVQPVHLGAASGRGRLSNAKCPLLGRWPSGVESASLPQSHWAKLSPHFSRNCRESRRRSSLAMRGMGMCGAMRTCSAL